MTAVLVTGATTPLGARLVALLLEEGYADRVLAVGIEAPDQTPLPRDERVQYAQVDLRRERGIRELLTGPARALGVEVLVHGPLHRSAADEGRRVHQVNVEATRTLLSLAERHPTLRRLVFRSHAAIYRVRVDQPSVFAEDHPIEFAPDMPQWLRDRVEADLTVCARMGLGQLKIAVLRCAEILAPNMGSQLHDYLAHGPCMRPLGYDPMLNVLSVEDAARALAAAVGSDAQGVFNVPGADTLPLSALIEKAGRRELPLPDPLLRPGHRLLGLLRGSEFRWDLNARRFHTSGVPDGGRARVVLGFEPAHPIQWPTARA